MKTSTRNLFNCLLTVCLLFVGTTVNTYAQEEIVYRDYTNMESQLLNRFRAGHGIPSFKGVIRLKQESREVKENTPVNFKPARMAKRKMKPETMVEKRRENVLVICKYLKTTTYPDTVMIWATATILSGDGICLTNYHVLRELIDPAVKLNSLDSILFVATESGKMYPITSVLSYNQAADMAFFKIDVGTDRLSPIPLGNDLPAGSNVHALTHPDGYLYYYSRGVVARAITKDSPDPFARRVEISADYAKGSSGGPILDDCGNMIGMVSSIRSIYFVNQPPMHQQMSVRSTIPVSSVRRMIQL